MFVMPTVSYDVAMHHLPQQMCAAASGMHLLPRDHVAGTHRILLALTIFATTFPDPDTSQRRMGEAAMVLWKFKVGGRLPRPILRTQTKIFIDAIGVNDFSGIN